MRDWKGGREMARRGRPLKAPTPGQRVGLSLRITPETKARLEKAANRSGRSLSQEAELRLELSFQSDSFQAAVGGLDEKIEKLTTEVKTAFSMAGKSRANWTGASDKKKESADE